MLFGVAALRSRAARRFLMRSRLADSFGVTVLCILETDGCDSMDRVILLLLSVWVAGPLGSTCTLGTRGMLGVCTLGTRCMLGVVTEGVATSSNCSGRACTWAFVASMIRWRSCAA